VWVPISEQELMHAQSSRPGPGEPKRKIDLILADGTVYPQKGEFAFADRQVDPMTGTIKVAVLFRTRGICFGRASTPRSARSWRPCRGRWWFPSVPLTRCRATSRWL